MSRTRIGVVGIAVIAVLTIVALNSGSIYRSLASHEYRAAFRENGNLDTTDDVEIGGVAVGKVTDIGLKNGHVEVTFTVRRSIHLGSLTQAAIKTAAPLGKKFLSVTPAGEGSMTSGSEIPLSRTNSPYDVEQALSDLTTTVSQIDTRRLAQSLNVTAQTFQNTPAQLQSALQGLAALSETIGSRDQVLRDLLSNANGVTGLLAKRSQQLNILFDDGNLLLNELYKRRADIQALLVNATQMIEQLNGLAQDNRRKLKPALEQVDGILALLNKNKNNIDAAIKGIKSYATGLGDAVASGPFFFAYLQNIAPTNLAPMVPELLGGGK